MAHRDRRHPAPGRLRPADLEDPVGPGLLPRDESGGHRVPRLRRRRLEVHLRRQLRGALLRLQGAADDHLLLQLHRRALPRRAGAEGGQGVRLRDDALHGDLGRRVAVGLGQHLRRPDRGAAAGAALCQGHDEVGADGGDDRRLRHHRGRRAGGLRRHGGLRRPPDLGERHVGAGGPGDGQAHVPGDRGERHRGRRAGRGQDPLRQRHRRRGGGRRRGAQAGAQRRRHAARLPRPDRGDQRRLPLGRRPVRLSRTCPSNGCWAGSSGRSPG